MRLLDANRATELASEFGIATPPQRIAQTPRAAAMAAAAIGFPVALKASAAAVVHKTEVGGVALGLADADGVRVAAAEMAASIPGPLEFVVQGMAGAGVELIVGARRDPVFGAVVVAGLGGIWAEALADVAIRPAPVSAAEAREMLDELRGAVVLTGGRGTEAVDLDSASSIVAAASRLIAEDQEVAELDLNPVICGPGGAVAVDLRILVDDASRPPSTSEQRLGPSELDQLFEPRSIAVVGASRDATKQGGRLLRYLVTHGYAGKLYAVNPRATEIMGCEAVPSIEALPEAPDLVCIALPSSSVLNALEACGERGIRNAIVFTAGFAEIGGDGVELQQQLTAVAQRYGIQICGPNTAGLVSLPARMCATMGMAFEAAEIPAGDIALLTQSGAIGGSLLSRIWEYGAGFSRWISVGNEADLGLGDYLLWLADDPATNVIVLFIEAIRDIERFRLACERARANGKAIVAYKTGASDAGRRAVQSHTAALAGDHAVYSAVLRSLGVIQVDDLQTLIDSAVVLSWQPLPAGSRVGVVSASGGACSVIADECERHGLELPQLAPEARARVAELVPSFAATDNPVDVTMEVTVRPAMIGRVAQVLLEEDCIDAVVVMLTTNSDPPAITVTESVIEAAAQSGKPVIVARIGADFLAPESLRRYRAAKIPVFPMPDRAVRALRAAVGHHKHTQSQAGRALA